MKLTREELETIDREFRENTDANLPASSLDFLHRFLAWSAQLHCNRVCYAGCFTGNDLIHLHTCFKKNQILVDAYDSYPWLHTPQDKHTMQQYVESKHADKPYITWKWMDVLDTDVTYSVIFNTAGATAPIEELVARQSHPCFVVNMSGSSWHLPLTDLLWVFRCQSSLNIFCNSVEAYALFKQFIQTNYSALYQRGFPIHRVYPPYLWGNINMTNSYKRLIKRFGGDGGKYSI